MRKTLAALLLVFLCGCPEKKEAAPPPPPPGPKVLDEREPNDAAAQAMPLKEPCVVRAALSVAPDRADDDFFRLEPAGAGQVATFAVSAIPGTNVAIELLDTDRNHVATFDSGDEGKPERAAGIGMKGPWLVRVYPVKKGSGGAYEARLTFDAAAPGVEVEPNNRAVDALPLALGTPAKGFLADGADEDWYRLEVPLPAGVTPTPAVAAADASVPTSPDAAPPAPPDASTAADASFEAADAAQVPAPTPAATASAPAPPPPPPPAPVAIKLEVAAVPGVRLQVELANEAQAVFYTARSREPGEGLVVRNLALRPGETSYFLVVKSAWTSTRPPKREANATEPYSVTVTVEEAYGTAELEPNDDAEHANLFAGDGMRQGFFAPRGDVDYFALRSDTPVVARVELSGVERVDSLLSLVRPPAAEGGKEETVLRANDGEVKEGELLTNVAIGPTPVLVRVEAAPRQLDGKWVRDQENANEPYRLTITSKPDTGADEREPNNDPAGATLLTLGKPVTGLVHPKRDVDLYKVDLSQSPVKVALKASVTGILKVDVALALYKQGPDGKLVLVQASDKGKGDKPESIRFAVEPGVYFVEVKDARNRESNFVDAYQLTVEQEQ